MPGNKFFNKKTVLLATIGIAVALSVHLFELYAMNLDNNLHSTADDPSYVRPAANFLEHGIWKDNSEGPSSYVQRPPLTGFVHLLGTLITGSDNKIGFFILVLFLHGIGIVTLFKTLRQYISERWATISTTLFLWLPCFYGFLSYSLSEALLVSSLLITGYFHLVPQRSQLTKTGSSLLLLYLFRPVLLLCFLPLFIYKLKEHVKKTEKKTSTLASKVVLFSLIGFTLFWEARKFNYTSTFSPHPIYHMENQSIFRPAHESLTKLFKIWEYQPEAFHALAGTPLKDDSVSRAFVFDYFDQKKPPISKEQFFKILLTYSEVNLKPVVSRMEQVEFQLKLDDYTEVLYAHNKGRYWLETPYLSAKENLKKTHLNLGIFQEKYRGNLIVELIRYGTLGLLLAGYLSLILIFFTGIKNDLKRLASGAWVYFIFLIEYQRMNEDRYFLPMIVLGYLSLSILTFHFSEYFRKTKEVSS
jgi:hypothetical protein